MAVPQEEALAIFTIIAEAAGLDVGDVLPGAAEIGRPDDPYRTVAESALWEPAKLELLAEAVRGQAGPTVDELIPLANSVLGQQRDDAAAQLISELAAVDRGTGFDPLGRTDVYDELSLSGELIELLHHEVATNVVLRDEQCEADQTRVGGIPALSIWFRASSAKPLADFYDIINPTRWPACWLQGLFFRRVEPAANSPRVVLPNPPDNGWRQVLLEEVDFSLGLIQDPAYRCLTELDVMFVDNDPGGSDRTPAIGATYEFHRSLDGKIVVDQGYLLGQEGSDGTTTIETLKQVRFSGPNPLPEGLCPIWSFFAWVLASACGGRPSGPKEPIVIERPGVGVLAPWLKLVGTTLDLAAAAATQVADCFEQKGHGQTSSPESTTEEGGRPTAADTLTLSSAIYDGAASTASPETEGFRRFGATGVAIGPDQVTLRLVDSQLEVTVERPPDSPPTIYSATITGGPTHPDPICDTVRFTTPVID